MRWILIFCFPTCCSLAQITVSGTNFSNVGNVDVFSSVNPVSVISPELTGANYNWDFSTITSMNQRSDTLISVTATPIGYQFYFNNIILYPNHKADYAIALETPDLGTTLPFQDVINFYKSGSSGFTMVGFGATINGLPLSVRYIPTDTIYDLPMDYGQSYTDSFAFNISIPGVGYYGQTGRHVDTVDGWGNITTPYGSFDVLRVKSLVAITDTTYIDALSFGTSIVRPLQTNYTWISQTEGAPIFKASVSGGQVISAEYLDSLIGLEVAEQNLATIEVYPNPVGSVGNIVIGLLNEQHTQIIVRSLSGQIVLNKQCLLHTGSNNIGLDLNGLSSGLYSIEIRTENEIQTSKLLIANP